MPCVIGIDVGSQSVKSVLVDDQGTALATASAPCAMSHPAGGWAEQDPAHWEQALAQTVREVREQAGVGREDVAMLGLACQVDGLVAMDERLRPLRPGIIWLDRRATRQSDALAAAAGEGTLIERTGLNPDASHTAPKAMWLARARPRELALAGSVLATGDTDSRTMVAV